MPKFKKGDFVFCEFKLQEIMEMKNDQVTEVSDGYFRHGSNDLNDRCFHLSLRVKTISDFFDETHDKIHKLKNNALNYPDMMNYLVVKWAECCETSNDKQAREITDSVEKWFQEVETYVKDDLKNKSIGGVKVFRS